MVKNGAESNIYHSQYIKDALHVPRPTVNAAKVLAISTGIGIFATVLETATGVYNYSREHRLHQRLVSGIRSLGEQAMSALGPISKAEDGLFIADSSTSMGYVIQEAPVPTQTQHVTGEVV